MNGGASPFQSPLRKHAEEILEWRRAGKTWKEVSMYLEDFYQLKYNESKLNTFIKRYLRKPYALGAEPVEGTSKPQENILEKIRSRAANRERTKQQ
jgi:hypothetical protein